MSQEDFYTTLGVTRTSEHWLIQLRYRTLMRRYHPDAGIEPDTARAQRINEAYDVLGDPQKRRRYDAQRATHTPARPERTSAPARTQKSKQRASVPPENVLLHRPRFSERAILWWLVAFYFTIAALLYLTR